MQTRAHRNIKLLTWFNFCDDFRVYNAVAVIYFAQISHSYALAGLVFSLAKVSAAVFEVPTGILSDLVQRRFTLVCGQVASTLAVLCYAVAGSFDLLACGAAFEGLAFALFSGNNDALLYDTLREEGEQLQFAVYQGRLGSMFQFALALSALVATAALGWLPYVSLFWISLAPKFLGLGLALGLREPARSSLIDGNIYRHLRGAVAGFARDAKLRTLTLASVIVSGLGESKFMLLPGFFALFWPPWALGLARLIGHLLAGTGFRLAGAVIGRFRESRVLLAAMPFSTLMGVSAIVASNVASPALYSVSSLPYGPASVAQASLLQKMFSERQRATMASIGSLAGSLFFAVAIFALGALADRAGLPFALLTAEILSIPTFVLYWRVFGKERQSVESEAS